LRKPNIA